MPIYVYGCNACGAVEEHLQRLSDPPLTECPHCGGRLAKQVTSAAFQLKGGGWYKDGYASAKAEKADKSSSSDAGGGSGGGTDSGGSKSTGGSPASTSSTSSGSGGSTAAAAE